MGVVRIGTATVADFAQKGWEPSRFIGTPSPDAPSLQNLPPAVGPPPLNVGAEHLPLGQPDPVAPEETTAPLVGVQIQASPDVQAAGEVLKRSILIDVTHHTLLMHGEPVDLMDEEVMEFMKIAIAAFERHQLSKVYALRNQFGVFRDTRATEAATDVPAQSQEQVANVLAVPTKSQRKKRPSKKEQAP